MSILDIRSPYTPNTEKAMAPHSSTLVWKTPWTEELGRLQSMGSLRVRHNWVTSLSLFTFMHWRRQWQPTPVFLPGESQGRGCLVGCRLWGCTSRTQLKWLSSSSSNTPNISTMSLPMKGNSLWGNNHLLTCEPQVTMMRWNYKFLVVIDERKVYMDS